MFWMPSLLKPRKINLARTDGGGSSTLALTHTFSAVDIGMPAPDRTVIVVLSAFADGGSNTYTESCTIGGSAATLVTRINLATRSLSIYRRDVPAGSTANVVATYNESVSCLYYAYSLTGAISSTPVSSNNQSSSLAALTFTQNVVANSVSLMAAAAVGITGTSHVWSGAGLTSPTTATGGYNNIRTSAAREEHTQAGAGLTFTATFSQSPLTHQGVWATWQ